MAPRIEPLFLFAKKKILLAKNIQITQSNAGINKNASHLKYKQFRNVPDALMRKPGYQKLMLSVLQICLQHYRVQFPDRIIPRRSG